MSRFYDKSVPSRNLVTTITGIITLILAVLVSFGVIDVEQQGQLQEHAFDIIDGVILIVGAVSAIILMFKAKD